MTNIIPTGHPIAHLTHLNLTFQWSMPQTKRTKVKTNDVEGEEEEVSTSNAVEASESTGSLDGGIGSSAASDLQHAEPHPSLPPYSGVLTGSIRHDTNLAGPAQERRER